MALKPTERTLNGVEELQRRRVPPRRASAANLVTPRTQNQLRQLRA